MLSGDASLVETLWVLRSGQLDLADYINAICTRLQTVESQLQALVPESDRQERLLKEAKRLLDRFPEPGERPPLFGLLVGVKDIFHADGFETRAGSKLPPEVLGGQEAACVSALKAAGAIILGKTVTTEFAYFEPGPTANPHNLAHTPGGSSSGSAAAVAAGYCPLALGSQTIGSVVRPAAFCGIVGFKPSWGRIDPAGLIHYSKSVDHVGIFAQRINGVGFSAPFLCRDWQEVTTGDLPVLGVPEGPYLEQASMEGLDAFNSQVTLLQAFGYSVKRVSMLEDIAAINQRHEHLISAELAQVHGPWFPAYEECYRPRTAAQIRAGLEVRVDQLKEGREGCLALRQALEGKMREAGIDLWICPSAPGPAPEGLESTGDPAMNLPWTHAGMPVVSLPAGYALDNMPLGLQCVGGFGQDERLVHWCEEIETVMGH
jgi:Asp-tRNA(Asn)/Glu-tRNA(Gln) amidotransferase A subunit family amidase